MSPPPPLSAHHTFAPILPHSTPLHPNPHKENIPPSLTPSTQVQRVEFAPTPYYPRGEGVDTHSRTAGQKTIPFAISAHRNNPCSPHSSGLQHVKVHT
ncbi:hypothetical protein CALVIDRAFT_536641 [Calocera viscosa TUFC12733]|uniref:Uncharacterized protein n=1 Tax=Calocera viscosa (strain TUFC12733) TaxID=1330018 RepID=A0A167MY90_CALVF|nr:hypothetical protein CALVIDRAFT_536641 [Calocera viscosa TUFC12733]